MRRRPKAVPISITKLKGSSGPKYSPIADQWLALCQRRIQQDWRERFGFPLLLETFVDNRTHWSVESRHYRIDWNYDEDRGRIRTGYGPENITCLRRFAISLLKRKKPNETIPENDEETHA